MEQGLTSRVKHIYCLWIKTGEEESYIKEMLPAKQQRNLTIKPARFRDYNVNHNTRFNRSNRSRNL